MPTIGERIRARRRELGLSQDRLGELAGVDRQTIGDAEISAYLAARRVPPEGKKAVHSNRTLRAELALLRRIAELAEVVPQWRRRRLTVTENPRRYVPPEELARLWTALEDGEPTQVALGLCALAGLRASEALRATAAHVDRSGATLTFAGRERKKGNPHTVALVPTLARLLPARGPLVAASPTRLTYRLRSVSTALGLPLWTGPGLGRHTFATWAHKYAGFTREQIKDALGHTKPGAIGFYLHAEAVEALLRPMAEQVERVLLEAIANLGTAAEVLPFRAEGRR
jgi:integrase